MVCNTSLCCLQYQEEVPSNLRKNLDSWKNNHKRKLDLSLRLRIPPNKYKKGFWGYRTFVGIKSIYPKKLLWENYCMKTQLYTIAFRVPHRHQQEIRISNIYDEPAWFNDNL